MFSFTYDAPQQQEDCVVDDLLIWAASSTAAAANDYTHYPPPPPPPVIPQQPYKAGDETLETIALGSGRSGGRDEDRKLSRKEIERRRRQQMSDLHSSLISLLPQPPRKGKKSSLSDQMGEAANYINHLKDNVQELSNRRDNLLKGTTRALPSSNKNSSSSATSSNSGVDSATNSVTIRQRFDGVEVVISRGRFVLSRVMEAVVEEGFDIMSCISTQIGGRFYNTMQCQASTGVAHIDLPGLQRKLNDIISYQ